MACLSLRAKHSRFQERKPIFTKNQQRKCQVSQFMLSNVLAADSPDKAGIFPCLFLHWLRLELLQK